MKGFLNKFSFNSLGAYLLRGTFILAPVFCTVYAIYKMFTIIDTPVQRMFENTFNLSFPGLGLLTIVCFLIFVGFLGTTILMDRVFKGIEKMILKIPVVKEIFKAIRDVIGAFASDKNKFEKPVLVKISEGVNRIGFITNEDLDDFDIDKNLIAVYFPLSYAFTGELLVIDKNLLTPLDPKDVKDLMKFIISGGIVHAEEEDEEVVTK